MCRLRRGPGLFALAAAIGLECLTACEAGPGPSRAQPLAIIPFEQRTSARRPGDRFSGSAPALQLAVDDAGNALVVWRQSTGDADVDLSRRLRVDGGSEAPQRVKSGCRFCPGLVLQTDASGNALAVWADNLTRAMM